MKLLKLFKSKKNTQKPTLKELQKIKFEDELIDFKRSTFHLAITRVL